MGGTRPAQAAGAAPDWPILICSGFYWSALVCTGLQGDYLLGELPGGRQHQGLGGFEIELDLLQDGDGKGGRLPRPRLRLRNDVVAWGGSRGGQGGCVARYKGGHIGQGQGTRGWIWANTGGWGVVGQGRGANGVLGCVVRLTGSWGEDMWVGGVVRMSRAALGGSQRLQEL